jgi:hypothetical protein
MASASSIPTNVLRSKRPRPLAPDGLHRHLAIFGRELVDVLSSFTRRGKARPELTPLVADARRRSIFVPRREENYGHWQSLKRRSKWLLTWERRGQRQP